MKTLTPEEFKKLYGDVGAKALLNSSKPKQTGFASNVQESIGGLKTLYGGGEQGIANKLKQDVQAGAQDIQSGNVVKGIAKAGLRTAGDVAGAVYAPIGAAIGVTGFGKLTDKIANSFVNSTIGNKITDNQSVQNFAMSRPNAGEDFNRALNLAFAAFDGGKIDPKTMLDRTKAQMTLPTIKLPDITRGKSVEEMRTAKIKQGFEEQNSRLKTADKSFNENTKIYKGPDGVESKVTPIDTFGKYNITPSIEKGSINMGDYKTGQGALGKIKEQVASLDGEIDGKIQNSGKGIPIEQFKQITLDAVSKDASIKRSGQVASISKKLESIFNDYQSSYGDMLSETEINAIRKVMNSDWKPETMDTSHVVGDAARQIIYDLTPDKYIQMLLRQQGELLSAKKYAETLNGTKVTGGRLGNMAMRTGGAIIGSTLHNLPVIGPLIGMLGGEYAARALQQSQFKSPIAEGKALLQRSNIKLPTTNAKIIPNNAIPKSSVKPAVKSTGLSTSKQSFFDATKANLKNKSNSQGGFIKNPLAKSSDNLTAVGKKTIKIHKDDLAEMSDFVDYTAGEYKPKNESDFKYYTRNMAKKYGINPNVSDKILRNKFLKVLEDNNFRN